MAIRNDIQYFPFDSKDRGVWYLVIDWDKKTEQAFSYVQEKRDLIPFLSSIIKNNQTNNFTLFGVWNGQYKTDLFKIPIEEAVNELKKYL